MALFDFGQPTAGIIQMAYVVNDAEGAIGHWVERLGAGPFFVRENLVTEDTYYRGKPCSAPLKIAIGFSGHMQIELIEPLDDQPSIYREVLDRSGPGFHHFCIATDDYDQQLEKHKARGHELALDGQFPGSNLRFAYLDTKGELPGFLEIVPVSIVHNVYTPVYRASVGWSGREPVRSM